MIRWAAVETEPLDRGRAPQRRRGVGKYPRVETEEGGSGYGELLFKQVGIVMSPGQVVECLGVCEAGWGGGEPGSGLGCIGALDGKEKRKSKSKRRDGRRGGSRMRRRGSSAAPQVNACEVELRVGEGLAVRALESDVSKLLT
jgi:hypothetical protein